ncbi:hypothetical protein FJZ19_03350 [Candidatus Pacearchaeota archaeon]|nr:hypothetical protein [Candidatus Pacearchaeota archaeon]
MIYNKDKREIILDRKLSNLDELVIEFIKILERYADYVVISGYISILLGRTRITEDIDVYIKEISFERFSKLYRELEERGFWCINAEKPESVYDYLKNSKAVRFARKNTSIPNFEVGFPKRDIDLETFSDFIIVILNNVKLKISSLERHIAFKRYYLETDKDIEDALHIEELFKEKIDYEKINKLKKIIERIKKEEENGERGRN